MGFSTPPPLLQPDICTGRASRSSPANTIRSSHLHHSMSTNKLRHHPQQQQQIQDHGHDHHGQNQFSFGSSMNMQASSNIPPTDSFIRSKDAGSYDLGELDQALFLYMDGQDNTSAMNQDHQRQTAAGMRPPTLNIFPSQPMHVDPNPSNQTTNTGSTTTGLVSSQTSSSKRPSEPSMELANARHDQQAPASTGPEPTKAIKLEGNRKGPTTICSEQEGPKTPDPKTLRRLAQNREAARKSRLRKKAYVQQLESSRIRLTQLEQELQRARTQGMFFGGGDVLGAEKGLHIDNISSDAAMFDMEYARWFEKHHRLTVELRAAVHEHLPENELKLFVENYLVHYNEFMNLKAFVAKTDVFHLLSGIWKSPAERCFIWIGGFRPSELIKIGVNQIEALTEQQIVAICGLQQTTQEAEEALSQALEALHRSVSDTITSDSLSSLPDMTHYMGQMAVAMNKLSTLEGFARQADNLRHQTIHRLHQMLTTRQAATCFVAISDYFHRLRSLSSLWSNRPRHEL